MKDILQSLQNGSSLIEIFHQKYVKDSQILYAIASFSDNLLTDNLIINLLKVRKSCLILNFLINKLEDKYRIIEILNTDLSLSQFDIIYSHIKDFLFQRLYILKNYITYLEQLEYFDDIIEYSRLMKELPLNCIFYNKENFERIIDQDEHISDEYFKDLIKCNLYNHYLRFCEISSIRIVSNIHLNFTGYQYLKNILRSTKDIEIKVIISDVTLIFKLFQLNKKYANRIKIFGHKDYEYLNEYLIKNMNKTEHIYDFHEFVMRCSIFPRGSILFNWLIRDYENRFDFLKYVNYNFEGILSYLSEIRDVVEFSKILNRIDDKQFFIEKYKNILIDNGFIGYFL